MGIQKLNHSQARRLVSEGRERKVQELHRLNDLRRSLDLLGYPALWFAGGVLSCMAWSGAVPGGLWVAAVGWTLSAVAINAQVLLLHEGMHGILLKSKSLNRWVSVVLGYSVLMSFTAYQVQHLRHHAFLGRPGDPDEYNNYAKPGWKLWVLQCTRILLGSILYIFLIPGLSFGKARGLERRRMLVEYGLLAVVLTFLLALVPGWMLAQVWGLPLLIVNFMINLRGLTQHSISDPDDAFLASRNTRAGAFMRLCLLEENYHLAHHLYPRVPSYQLHDLDLLLRDRYLREAAALGYLWFLAKFLSAMWRRDWSPIGTESHG